MHRQWHEVSACCLLLVVACALALAAQVTSPFAGTWKLNRSKSTYDPGPPPTREVTVLVEARANGEAVIQEQVDPQGRTTGVEFTATFDGKTYPIEGDPSRDSVSNARIDEHSFEATFRKGGKVVTVNRTTVSRDGKVRTVTVTGTDSKGRPIHNVVVFDRQ